MRSFRRSRSIVATWISRASRTLRRVDAWYGISAALVVVSGVLRVTLGLKGAAFYLHNPIFWTKMGFFVAIALLSIPPTIHYLRLGARADASGLVAVDPGGYPADVGAPGGRDCAAGLHPVLGRSASPGGSGLLINSLVDSLSRRSNAIGIN